MMEMILLTQVVMAGQEEWLSGRATVLFEAPG